MNTILAPSDRRFLLTTAMPHFGLKRLNIDYSASRKTWPDLWIDLSKNVPVITVTQEFLRQPEAERCKRLTHELIHLRFNGHNEAAGYSTIPARDRFSKKVYRQLVRGNPGKEAWRMTREEYLPKIQYKNYSQELINRQVAMAKHKLLVEQALYEDKPIPEAVLKDYPYLKVRNPGKEPWMMTREERLAEAARLERENRSILATPLMSEGNISPMQVGMFSPRQKAKYQADASTKMNLEAQIRYLRKSDEEIQRDIIFRANKEREARISQLKRQISDIEGLGLMSHLPNGKLKVGYQRTVDIAKQELQALSEGKPVPEAVLKSHNPFLETMLTGAALAIGFKGIGYAEKALLKRRKRKGK